VDDDRRAPLIAHPGRKVQIADIARLLGPTMQRYVMGKLCAPISTPA
jgi:hypothetical protein